MPLEFGIHKKDWEIIFEKFPCHHNL